jgi:hypothetical protein
MIFRLSTKLSAKLKVALRDVLPADPDPFADWSGHVFTADRTQFLIVTNTASLYSTVFPGSGVSSDRQFIERALDSLREFMAEDGLSFIQQRFIAPASGDTQSPETPFPESHFPEVQFSKALNRSVTGSMNDLIFHAKAWLTDGELSPHETAFKLNDIPFAAFQYRKPREVFTGLAAR